jgi:hypothetical protein
MRRVNVLFRSTARRLQQRGSALLASLMVIVGLSLLGLAFVAISETESSISNNQKNHSEAVAVAEAGGKLVVQWFQDPDKMEHLGLLPPNTNTLKTQRTVFSTASYYKQDLTTKLCDLPFGPKDPDEFFGLEDSADVIIDRSTADGRTFLDAFNTKAFGDEGTVDPRPAGEITMIKIFAPPIVGATVTQPNAPHNYEGGTRYGVATIMVRAEKFDRPLSAGPTVRRSLALSECRIVVSQFPTPQPGGPLQSATALATNGAFNVHWGLVSSQQSLDLKKDYTTMPWFNAWEPINFQRGYDSSVQWTADTLYRVGDIVRPTQTAMAANNLLRFHEYTVTVSGTTSTNEPAWPTTPAGATVTLDGVTYAERSPTAYPLSAGGSPNPTNTPWLYYIASGNVSVDDPWFHARASQDVVSAGTPPTSPPNSNPQPWSFFPWTGTPDPRTHVFQFQSLNQYPDYKQLIFPIFNYDYWKAAAIAGNGQPGVNGKGGVHYLEWVSADTYTDGSDTKTFRNWVASATSEPGFYFFETQNKLNPQNGGPGVLAPEVQVNGGNVGAYMSSFVYLNAPFSTTGLGGITGHFNQPGEPYLDIGYRQVDEASSTGDFNRDASGAPVVKMAANRQWDYQDLAWSNTGATGAGGGTKNQAFDVCVGSRAVINPANPTGGTYTGFFPIPYRPGCRPGNNVDLPGCNCSEPHEPYLNIRYNGSTSGITFGWFDPATAVSTMRLPKKTTGGRTDAPVTCTASSSQTDCTSNAYDLDGALADLTPVTDGVFYVEGNFDSKGNADYYGAVLVGGTVQSQGTPTIWYDESLSRGIRLSGFPRVMITSLETDR